MSYDWGPHFLVPSGVLDKYSGHVRLREQLDEELLQKELKALGFSGVIRRITNPWYYRKKGAQTWIKLGESDDKRENFPVSWDTTTLENGVYEVLGMMHVFGEKDNVECGIARQSVVEITLEN